MWRHRKSDGKGTTLKTAGWNILLEVDFGGTSHYMITRGLF